jgi:hypothetical protein
MNQAASVLISHYILALTKQPKEPEG